MRTRHAFTLIELLVVISIIALLIGILLPALGAARKSARAIACASNLKGYGNAHYIYAADNKDSIVAPVARTNGVDINFVSAYSTANWNEMLMDTMIGQQGNSATSERNTMATEEYVCPEFDTSASSGSTKFGYGMNRYIPFGAIESEWGDRYVPYNYSTFTDSNAWLDFLRFDHFTTASEWIINGDSYEWALDVPTTGFLPGTPSAAEPNKKWEQGDPDRHATNSANYLYMDGHAGAAPGRAAFVGLRDPKNKKNLTYNGPQ